MKKNKAFKYPGKLTTTNGNTLVTETETLIAEAGIFFPITPSTEMGEIFQANYAKGKLNAFGKSLTAIETEGEHSAQGGAIAMSVTGKRTVNFTSGQGLVYGVEQYYHAPGKLSTMVLEVGARALTKHALNVHCGHDDINAVLDTGWTILFASDAQQAADQSIILRKVNEICLNPGINTMDGFLTTHLERTFLQPEAELIREFLGSPDDQIESPSEAQKFLFGEKRRRVPKMIDLENPILLGPVQNQEHYMNGVAARRNNFSEDILPELEKAYEEFYELTGRSYGLISEYNTDNTETVFIALGSAVENIQAVLDYLKETRNEDAGVIHVNVIRPFPEAAIIKALKGKKNVIVLERTDESLSGDNPLTRDIRAALNKAYDQFNTGAYPHLEGIDPNKQKLTIFSGSYGLGSRDFRPEGIIGAYDFAQNRISRTDGMKASDGARFFFVGIDHPYAVLSDETPSCLPADSVAIRFHSIGGWGMITTGKNLGAILGDFSKYVAKRDNILTATGEHKEIVHISANPKYGSEKKGAPTNYFLVAAKERVRVNCDLNHVNVVLCCDPKIFLHTNPLNGLEEGGAFVWESSETSDENAWQRIPKKYRKEIIDKKIRVFLLNGFEIAKSATNREDLQTRMQGNSFLGSFFKVSSFLEDYNIKEDEFLKTVRAQYDKKFGKLGEKVVESNMKVMQSGFDNVHQLKHGDEDAPDTSRFIGFVINPSQGKSDIRPNGKAPIFKMSTFDSEFRSGFGYNQPSSPMASVGMMASATGMTSGKYVARRQIPVFLAENCTQCMECMVVCPDSAMPSTAQDISSVLHTSIRNYISEKDSRDELISNVGKIESMARARMLELAADKEDNTLFGDVIMEQVRNLQYKNVSKQAIDELDAIVHVLPIAYHKTKAIFSGKEKKESGSGGVFGIFINDLCKGCAACVDACGKHGALRMESESEQMHADYKSATGFLNLTRDTPDKYLGLYNNQAPQESKAATLKMHLMIQSKYQSFAAGDGACAGCGEKTVLKAVSTLTESLMKPLFTAKAERLYLKADELDKNGVEVLNNWEKSNSESYLAFRRTVLHVLAGMGAENEKTTESIIKANFNGGNKELMQVIVKALRTDAEKHVNSLTIEGMTPDGMNVMAMTAHTGCNTVYGSTPPNNPHLYPWMNSLFQDGATIGWIVGESFIRDHGTLSVIPERLSDILLDKDGPDYSEENYFDYTHFSDSLMTDSEVMELPKVWAVGGDGGMGDIGFQNVSKAILQNRPNLKMLLMDTQVYSNTGGQNSDSSVLAGGFDMNQVGAATGGKLTEKKSVSEAFLGGHGSPYIAQVSMANASSLYKSILDGLTYRGTAFIQAFTTCQPEHGVADHAAQIQAQRARDSRGIPEFVFNSQLGESYQEALNIKGNPGYDRDWFNKLEPVNKNRYQYTVAHWAFSEARFRLHHKIVEPDKVKDKIRLEDLLQLVTMDDIVHHRYKNKNHRAYIPDFGVFTIDYDTEGNEKYHIVSRQMVIFCVERRKAWRMLQSRAGIENKDYQAQKELLHRLDTGEATVDEVLGQMAEKEK